LHRDLVGDPEGIGPLRLLDGDFPDRTVQGGQVYAVGHHQHSLVIGVQVLPPGLVCTISR
jgi:hypothetical protein